MKVDLKVVGGSRSGQLIPIAIPSFMIGRAEDCHLKPRSELISRYHCVILSEEAYVAVRDLGSKNGVYVNGRRVDVEQELKNGDRLAIGPLEFEVVLTVELKSAPKPKIASIADVVARTVEQNSINVATAKQGRPQNVASAPQPDAPVPQPVAPALQPVAPALQPVAPALHPVASAPQPVVASPEPAVNDKEEAKPGEPVAESKPEPQKTQPAADPVALFTNPTIGESNGSSEDSEASDLADWLLGDDDADSGGAETQTMQIALNDLDLPYTPKEPEEEKVEEKPKSSGGPNSSDAAANLLKNFFKGGR